MKNSFSLFEVILTILISSIIIVFTTVFIKDLYFINNDIQIKEEHKIDILAAKNFLQKQKNIDNYLTYKNNTLYFKNSILLEDVTNYNLKKHSTYIQIDLLVNNSISQTWKIIYE